MCSRAGCAPFGWKIRPETLYCFTYLSKCFRRCVTDLNADLSVLIWPDCGSPQPQLTVFALGVPLWPLDLAWTWH